MHFSTVVLALAGATTAVASAIPGKSTLMDRQAALCSGASNSPVCCATDVLGVADLDCAPRKSSPSFLMQLEKGKTTKINTDACLSVHSPNHPHEPG